MNAFFHALAFLTRFPVPIRLGKEGFRESPVWYPLVGFLLGGVLFLFDQLIAGWFPAPVRVLLDLSAWVFFTGGLHLDGWMDMADGFGSHRDPDKIREIMKDSRVGAMGAIAAILLLMLKAGSLFVLAGHPDASFARVWITACIWGRMAAVIGIRFFPYAGKDGLGQGMRERFTWPRFCLALVCTVLPVGVGLGSMGLVVGLFAVWVPLWIGWKGTRTLGGCTGDLYGAMIEASELTWLLFFTIPGVLS
ncbi:MULTISPECIES: adenosylcobinamide-GDP ribazoletransferase [Thermoactinomyces]|jgi:adenosylcobinamide-GDP ribazoletransferase|uniref:Adenosylcobinamide-GDP ribazoletransferase n=1 Tax=Thermoactinomyces vulgaris TaxID=2026 RepID=A0ABS0QHB2_THEVU|nr:MULTISPECIES: adenosylcobinamide-GDP ribazoletransferase [Thermoactinomyces]KFZ40442.1 hypothetical protein JS81_08145 [Thermoactinomyces sp. Gus2-1]KYQ86604.1 hypothetical protein AYX07_05500 [Thermoactinomyces sp. AS95]MBA4550874.1 adenosylcobinamide-GDP ribazoletransferase [Thermoactinomyces vulgaris]MBA4596067.1 adenosylcobinamide-GDP ribazoletransferase [Thermoactinomyces vulgaris]MBH8585989.1 adenosylcobinamide-GDP ribazoletransferase [Thermoactinomyces sp. CICC 10520]